MKGIGLWRFLIVTLMVALVGTCLMGLLSALIGHWLLFIISSIAIYIVGVILAIDKVIKTHLDGEYYEKILAYGYLSLLLFVGAGIWYVSYIS